MIFQINDLYHVSDYAHGDQPALVEHLREKQIYDQTLAIPHPYTQRDADWWIEHNLEATRAQGGRSVNWAIRKKDGALIGGIGFLDLKIGQCFKGELGYWLAKPYWGQGIMTEAARKSTAYAFREFGLVRVTANVFVTNLGSARVLEKSGFQLEGVLRSHYKKDGKIFDGKLYGKLATDA